MIYGATEAADDLEFMSDLLRVRDAAYRRYVHAASHEAQRAMRNVLDAIYVLRRATGCTLEDSLSVMREAAATRAGTRPRFPVSIQLMAQIEIKPELRPQLGADITDANHP